MGGAGKTTLATSVYKIPRVRSHFHCDAWISVSQTNIIDDLLKRIIKELYQGKRDAIPHDIDSMNYINLVQTLQMYLQNKRYLIILDDVWRADVWDLISHALIDNDLGGRVVITTRSLDVALIAPDSRLLKLEPLGDDEAWILFCKHAFRKEKDNCCPQELNYWARKIVARCDGLPLAITTIGNLLSRKEKTEFQWKSIHDGLVWGSDSDLVELQKVSIILNFSINDLPYYLRKCLFYCSIFPEDYEIERNRLIRLWVAEGFIEKRRDMSLEEIAEYYFNQLVGRCMLQPVKWNGFGRVRYCRIHDLMRDLIVEKSRAEDVPQELDNNYLENNSNNGVRRRLSITKYERGLQLSQKMPQVRSLHVFLPNFSCSMLPSGFRLLRVLDLSGASLERLPDEVVHLFNLSYLSIRDSAVRQLPKAIGRLQNLETLDARTTYLGSLPRGITMLEKLRHLMVSHKRTRTSRNEFLAPAVDIPRGIWKLKGLQTLKRVKIDAETARHLGNLTQIRTLHACVSGIHSIQLSAAVVKMEHLVNLCIMTYVDDTLQLEAISPPPPRLLKLQLQGKLENGVLPFWLGSLANLKYLTLFRSKLGEDSIVSLSLLRNLVGLFLHDAYDGEKLCFRTGWLPNLRALQLHKLPHLRCIEIEKGALVSLTDLCLLHCIGLKVLPVGIESLVHLQHLEVEELPDEFVQTLLEKRHGKGSEQSNKDGLRFQHITIIRNWVKTEDGGWEEERFA